jgi:hypothetical protein
MIYSNHIIEKFTDSSLINTHVLSLQEMIIALQNQEPITSEQFINFQNLIKNINSPSIIIYTSIQYDIINQINLFDGLAIPSSLFIQYAEKVIPNKILPTFATLYNKLLIILIPNDFLPFHQIVNTNILIPIITELLSVQPETTEIKKIELNQIPIISELKPKLVIEPFKNITNNFSLYIAFFCTIVILIIIIYLIKNH